MSTTGRGLLVAALVLLGACSDDDDGAVETTTTTEPAEPSTTTTTAAEETTTTADPTATTGVDEESDPLEAGQAFLDAVFPDNRSTFGEFQQGDPQSGELPVFRVNEGGGAANLAAVLLLRLDASNHWQVTGAFSEFVTIEAPSSDATVPAGPLTVSGVGRGFEANLGVLGVGIDGGVVAQTNASGGAQAEPLPYATQLDLSTARSGDGLYVVVHGGSGLEGDTGEFAAVRVFIE